MGGDISEIRVSARFYQETKKAAADGILDETEKQRLQQMASETASSADDTLLAVLEDTQHVRAFQQASATGDVPAYIDIPASEDATLRVTVQTPVQEALDEGTAHLRASEEADAWGDKELERQELEKARESYQRALQLDPGNTEGHHQVGLVLFRLDKLEDAIVHYRRALELAGENAHPIIYSNLGLAYARQGNLELARENLEKAARKLPNHLDTQYMLGVTLQKLGRLEEALAQYGKVVELDPEGRYSRQLAAKIRTIAEGARNQARQAPDQQTKLAHTDKAIAAYELLKRVSPDSVQASYELGQLHYSRAINSYTLERICGVGEAYQKPHRNYANEDVRSHLDKAVEAFQAVVKARPDIGEAHYFLGLIHNFRGEIQPASQALQEAVQRLPDDPDVHEEIAKNLLQQRQWEPARQSYERAIDLVKKQMEKKPDDPQLKKKLAGLLVDLSTVYYQKAYVASEVYPDEFRKAADLNAEALKLDPQNELAKRNLSYLSRLTLEGPLFEEFSERYLGSKSAPAYHAMSYYAGMRMAAEAPDAKPEVKEYWGELKQHIDGITGKKDFIPISYLNTKDRKTYHVPLVGGTTSEGKYRIVDPMTNRIYEGQNRSEAMRHFLNENQYPEGRLRYINEQGQIIERRLSGKDHTADTVATVWTGVALLALAVTIVAPNPVTGAIAISGLAPGAYFAGKGAFEIADRLQHGQKVTWDMWALEATQVVGVLLGVGAVAGAIGGGARAAGALAATGRAASGASEAISGMTQAQRFVAMQRFFLAANLTNDAVAAAAMSKQLIDITGRSDIPDDQKMAAIFQTMATLALSTGLNIRNIQSVGGLKGMQRIARMNDVEFQRFMSLPEAQRLAILSQPDELFKPTKGVNTAVDEVLTGKLQDQITPERLQAKRQELIDFYERQGYGISPDRITDALLKRLVLGDLIYEHIYNPAGTPKPATITQEQYNARLNSYDGPTHPHRYWHFRTGRTGDISPTMDIRRFYFNVLPDKAADMADFIVAELNKQGIRFQYKMPKALSNFDRTDAAVLYVDKADQPAVKKIILEYARQHPEAFAEGSPSFTKAISPGIAVAEEPIQQGLPSRVPGHSFGTSRADIIAEAILDAPSGATPEQIKQLVRQRLQNYGIDPDRPWMNPGSSDNL